MRNIVYTPINYSSKNRINSLLGARTFGPAFEMRPTDEISPFKEVEDHYYLYLHFPGLKKDFITLQVVAGSLRITAKSPEDALFKIDYSKAVELPDDVNEDAISAKLEDGVLRVTLQKEVLEESIPRVIEIF